MKQHEWANTTGHAKRKKHGATVKVMKCRYCHSIKLTNHLFQKAYLMPNSRELLTIEPECPRKINSPEDMKTAIESAEHKEW